MNYFKYLDDLPKFSKDVLDKAMNAMSANNNTFVDPKHSTYQFYRVHDTAVLEFTKTLFNFDHIVAIQVIKKGVPVHIDIGRKVAFNYIIETGGDNVLTGYYNIDDFDKIPDKHIKLVPKINMPPAQPVYTVCLDPMRWHKLDVSVPHGIINVEKDRIAVTVTPIVPLSFND